MFACFGLKSRHKQLSPPISQVHAHPKSTRSVTLTSSKTVHDHVVQNNDTYKVLSKSPNGKIPLSSSYKGHSKETLYSNGKLNGVSSSNGKSNGNLRYNGSSNGHETYNKSHNRMVNGYGISTIYASTRIPIRHKGNDLRKESSFLKPSGNSTSPGNIIKTANSSEVIAKSDGLSITTSEVKCSIDNSKKVYETPNVIQVGSLADDSKKANKVYIPDPAKCSTICSKTDYDSSTTDIGFTRTVSLKESSSFFKGSRKRKDKTPATPLIKMASRRKKLRQSESSELVESKYPVKILRPNLLNGQTPTPSDNNNKVALKGRTRGVEKCAILHKAQNEAEALKAKEEARALNRKTEALTVLIHYLTNEYEAFSTKKLKTEIRSLSAQLTDTRLSLDESSAALKRYESSLSKQAKDHSDELQKLRNESQESLQTLKKSHEDELASVTTKHQTEYQELVSSENRKLEELKEIHKTEISQLEECWKERLNHQSRQHFANLEERDVKFSQQVKDIESTWQDRERDLQDQNCKLLKAQDSLKEETKALENSLLSDKDHRLQAAKKVCTSLQNEVDSLKAVLEMRNSEIHKLRDQIADKERMQEELDGARIKIKSLQAKTEDLQAQLEYKHNMERQLLTDHHNISESLQKEISTNKRLTLENEELQWKLRQRETSSSLPSSNNDLPPGCRKVEGSKSPEKSIKQRGMIISPKMSPRNLGVKKADRKWSQSFTNIPEDANRSPRCSNKEFLRREDVGIDSPPLSPRVKGVIEKSSSVSFILDLNDSPYVNESSLNDSSFLRSASPHHYGINYQIAPAVMSPAHLHQRRSRARSVDEKEFSRKTKKCSPCSKPLMRGTSTPMTFQTTIIDGKLKTKAVPYTEVHRLDKENEEADINLSDVESIQFHQRSRCRNLSTSESSDGGDVERISPTGLSWTVPIRSKTENSVKNIPTRFHVVPEIPRHLHLTNEDEYDENENEFVEVLTLSQNLNSDSLKTILNPTPSTSLSFSDSDMSQCGSRIDVTTEEDSSDQDDNNSLLYSSRPLRGAGEAMVIPDAFFLPTSKMKNIEDQLHIPSNSEEQNRASSLKSERNSSSSSNDIRLSLTSSSEA